MGLRKGYVQAGRNGVCKPGTGGGAQSWRLRPGADEDGVQGYRLERLREPRVRVRGHMTETFRGD